MLELVIQQAEKALRSWEPQWTMFLDGALLHQACAELQRFGDLQVHRWGGYAGAERQRLLLARSELCLELDEQRNRDLAGLELLGNFLFDPAEPEDFRQGLLASGLAAGQLGDVWLRGDRGAQAIVLAGASPQLDGPAMTIRSVAVDVRTRPLAELQLPAPRQPRRLSTVEASLRLDAVGSAGFGLSRSRMVALIDQGAVRLNWQPIGSGSKELRCGDRIQLQGRGELVLEAAVLTKKNRWRVELTRI
ncbi:MAG: photosystem II S4 domain protein [Cyanobacteria bacterium K_DeepCast_35m_m2_023]|nr:photosystem II S4 domain protein [Cyanobacteria bacterium K_DeepCast_35m_m2_023]